MPEYAWRPLGELLVRRGLIDEYQLESLLLEQRLSGQLFGEMLVSKRLVSPIHMAVVIAEQHGLHLDPADRPVAEPPKTEAERNGSRKWRPLGRILVDRELLTESGLQRVLLAQRRKGGMLGELLLERGYVTPEQLAQALAEQHGVAVEASALSPRKTREEQPDEAQYEVRTPGDGEAPPIHVSPSFLDASDFAFELLYDEEPAALEIVEVTPDRRRVAWSYARPSPEPA